MHPSEDWAETFAHVLHVTDVLLAADAFGLRLDPDGLAATALPAVGHVHSELTDDTGDGAADVTYVDGHVTPTGPDPITATPMRSLLQRFVPIAFALNEVTRAMGEGDLYPFVLTEEVAVKLELVAGLVGIGEPS
jgi:prepilin-type processing-associated H-X9-DG protein